MQGKFIIVGENIHCTRVRLKTGKFVTELPDGRQALVFKADGQTRHLPIPADIVAGEEWANGKVRHVAVAVRQGLHGTGADQAAGIAYLQAMAKEQQAAGAHFLDLNVDEFSMDMDAKLRAVAWTVAVLQDACPLPLSIDSSNPAILKAGLEACDVARGKPLVNSVSLERAASIEVAASVGAKVIAGATGVASMPESVKDRMDNIAQLVTLLKGAGIGLEDTYLDPLVFPISVDATNGLKVIDTICACRELYGPTAHFAPGLSNVSFGLPKRPLINQVFAYLCHAHGCDGGIVDPAQINDQVLASMDTSSVAYKLASALLCGTDEYGAEFIAASRDGSL
jgi:5-methyltetrahydrofolate--homocysteine methyltransferase